MIGARVVIIAVVSTWRGAYSQRSLLAPWDGGGYSPLCPTLQGLQAQRGVATGGGRPGSWRESQARTPGRHLTLGTPFDPQATSGDLSPTSGLGLESDLSRVPDLWPAPCWGCTRSLGQGDDR